MPARRNLVFTVAVCIILVVSLKPAVAEAHILAGIGEQYQQLCRELFQKHATSSHKYTRVHLATLCCLAPGSGITAEELASVLDETVQDVHANNLALTMGMFEFRRGNYEAARERITAVGDDFQVPASLMIESMCASQLGRKDEARKLLQQGIQEFDTRIPDPEGPELADHLPDRWVVWGQLQVLRQEAERMLKSAAESE